jgi:hypothetical protein
MIETIPEELTRRLLRAFRWRTPLLQKIERRAATEAEQTISFSTAIEQPDERTIKMARGNIAEAFADQIFRAGGELTSEIELELRQNPNRYAGLTQFEITPDHKLLIGTLILKHEHSGPKEDFTDLVMQVRPGDTPLLQALPRRALKEAEEIQMFVKLLGFDQTGRLNPADQAGKESLALRTSESAGELKLEIESELAKHPCRYAGLFEFKIETRTGFLIAKLILSN